MLVWLGSAITQPTQMNLLPIEKLDAGEENAMNQFNSSNNRCCEKFNANMSFAIDQI